MAAAIGLRVAAAEGAARLQAAEATGLLAAVAAAGAVLQAAATAAEVALRAVAAAAVLRTVVSGRRTAVAGTAGITEGVDLRITTLAADTEAITAGVIITMAGIVHLITVAIIAIPRAMHTAGGPTARPCR